MAISDIYGEGFGKRLNAKASSFASRALPKSIIAVTELKYDAPDNTLSTPPVEEDAFVAGVHLKLFERYRYWENGKGAMPSTLRPGETIIYDIKRQPTFHLNSAFHSVHFYVPRTGLDAITEDAGAPRIEELHYSPAVSHADPVLRNMAEALLPLFSTQERVSQIFMDHVLLAVGHHLATTYGGMRIANEPVVSGGLAPWQERRAKELLRANLAGDLPLAILARECGLSASQFCRAFRKSVGMPPHRWMVGQRVDRAKSLLREGAGTLSEIAFACGFADQSHFTRCFTAWTGTPPGRWRKMSVR
jgi:AraC-like DNA-binding protein